MFKISVLLPLLLLPAQVLSSALAPAVKRSHQEHHSELDKRVTLISGCAFVDSILNLNILGSTSINGGICVCLSISLPVCLPFTWTFCLGLQLTYVQPVLSQPTPPNCRPNNVVTCSTTPTCACRPGYVAGTGANAGNCVPNTCIPNSQVACTPGGDCSCTCSSGYTRDAGSGLCVPSTCPDINQAITCTGQTCSCSTTSCKTGFTLATSGPNAGRCVPTTCMPNGGISCSPTSCSCSGCVAGYTLDNQDRCVPSTCPDLNAVITCDINGNCVCSTTLCKSGFVHSIVPGPTNGRCVPTDCTPNSLTTCPGATNTACDCNACVEGFSRDTTSGLCFPTTCVPNQSIICVAGECSCAGCNLGYTCTLIQHYLCWELIQTS
ncbi:hypothetical protein BT69DRAFT_814002 [Atractiella rhizophila]|nr:hypothetical protein BT69DRAFT_814002 [Atractiella rhizophila]